MLVQLNESVAPDFVSGDLNHVPEMMRAAEEELHPISYRAAELLCEILSDCFSSGSLSFPRCALR